MRFMNNCCSTDTICKRKSLMFSGQFNCESISRCSCEVNALAIKWTFEIVRKSAKSACCIIEVRHFSQPKAKHFSQSASLVAYDVYIEEGISAISSEQTVGGYSHSQFVSQHRWIHTSTNSESNGLTPHTFHLSDGWCITHFAGQVSYLVDCAVERIKWALLLVSPVTVW